MERTKENNVLVKRMELINIVEDIDRNIQIQNKFI